MAAQGGRSLEVPADAEPFSTNSQSLEGSNEFIASSTSDTTKLDRLRGLFRRKKNTKKDGDDTEEVKMNKNRPYGELGAQATTLSKLCIWCLGVRGEGEQSGRTVSVM